MSKPVTNNVDIATLKVKQLQSMIYDSNKSREDMLEFTKDILISMDEASKEIQANFAEISKELTKLMNPQAPQK